MSIHTHDNATVLTTEGFDAALAELADYEQRIAESSRLSDRDTLRVAGTLDRLYRDPRWVVERNAERVATAKTPRGGRPVDPTSRSQFATWVRGRFNQLAPRTVYQLLDAQSITTSYLRNAQITPKSEHQLRPLKVLLKVAHGSGDRIPEVWNIAVGLADGDQPTHRQVREAIAEWRRLHLTKTQQRWETAIDRAQRKRGRAVAAWKDLLAIGSSDDINAFLDVIRKDIEQVEETGQRSTT